MQAASWHQEDPGAFSCYLVSAAIPQQRDILGQVAPSRARGDCRIARPLDIPIVDKKVGGRRITAYKASCTAGEDAK